MTSTTQLVLAGGGHSHALLLHRWAMHPRHRPEGLITLVNRSSTSLYSGMAGADRWLYSRDQVAIDLRPGEEQAAASRTRALTSQARPYSSRADCLCPSLS